MPDRVGYLDPSTTLRMTTKEWENGASGTSHPTRNALLAPHQEMGAGGKNKPPSEREVSRFTETEGAYKSIRLCVLPQSLTATAPSQREPFGGSKPPPYKGDNGKISVLYIKIKSDFEKILKIFEKIF